MPSLRDQLVSALEGRYDVVRELGHGGMAYVFLAHDLKHDRQVAIKVLKPELATTIGVERFRREIRITARLEHPNILRLYASDNVGTSLLYYVVQYVPGDSLRRKLDREAQLPLDEALAITRQVAAALDYAHAHGVIHRDIKPANILLHDGQAIVADFGLARMYDATDTAPITQSAVVMGTPAYMSPEQVSADAELDGRTDVYSLACVFFEMVAGTPPFHASTRQALYGLHLSAPPPSLCAERENCPPEMDAAVQRAMSKVPADRFRTAGEFVRALEGGGASTAPAHAAGQTTRRSPVRRLWMRAAAVIMALGVVALAAMRYLSPGSSASASALNQSSYALIAFSARANALDTSAITARVGEALAEWQGVDLVDDRTIGDAVRHEGGDIRTVVQGARVARNLGAGRLIWGEADRDGDSIVVRATLYDAASAKQVRSKVIKYAAAERPSVERFRPIATALLRQRDEPVIAIAGHRPSLVAWRAYDDGRAAASRWDLQEAQNRFRDAVTADDGHAQAQLWLAVAQMWDGQPRDAWRPAARRARQLKDRLTATDQVMADAMLAQADGEFPDACRAFSQLIALDSSTVVGWYGLGECQSRDAIVMRDPKSPTGYRFRSSFQNAIRAYRHLIDDRPPPRPAFVYRRLLDLLYIEAIRYRPGQALGNPSRQFAAYPGLDAETLAFIPYPKAKLLEGGPDVIVPRKADAIDHNRALLRNLYAAWVRSAPTSVEAHAALAGLLEMTEELKSEGSDELSAITQNAMALQMASDTIQRWGLARSRVRLLVKTGDWTRAAAFADSLFAAAPHPVNDTTVAMVGVAALTGRIGAAAEILRAHPASSIFQFTDATGAPIELKPTVQRDILTAYAFAMLGACTDSVRALPRRLDVVLPSYVADTLRRATRDALVGSALVFAVPCLGPRFLDGIEDGGDKLIAMVQAVGRHDAPAFRRLLGEVQAVRRADRPGETAIEYVYMESWLLAQLGDTAGAIVHLDRSLNALPTLGRYLLDRPSQSAGLVRAMGLRAELAAATADPSTARRWGTAVATLWRNADPELQPYVRRMRSFSARPG